MSEIRMGTNLLQSLKCATVHSATWDVYLYIPVYTCTHWLGINRINAGTTAGIPVAALAVGAVSLGSTVASAWVIGGREGWRWRRRRRRRGRVYIPGAPFCSAAGFEEGQRSRRNAADTCTSPPPPGLLLIADYWRLLMGGSECTLPSQRVCTSRVSSGRCGQYPRGKNKRNKKKEKENERK